MPHIFHFDGFDPSAVCLRPWIMPNYLTDRAIPHAATGTSVSKKMFAVVRNSVHTPPFLVLIDRVLHSGMLEAQAADRG